VRGFCGFGGDILGIASPQPISNVSSASCIGANTCGAQGASQAIRLRV
jgi:hypothetical protein